MMVRTPQSFIWILVILLEVVALHACSSSDNDSTGSVASGDDFGPILDPGGPGAATSLQAEITCSDVERRKGLAQLSWTLADPLGTEQQVIVTIFKDGFETGAFEASKVLPPTQSSFLFEAVQGQALHRWRVLTVQAQGVVPSETARFEGPVCIGDVVVEEEPPVVK